MTPAESDSKLGHAYGVKHLIAQTSGFISEVLVRELNLTIEQSSALVGLGSVYCKDLRCEKTSWVSQGDYLRVHLEPRRFDVSRFVFPEMIVFQNDDFLVINKPAGLPVHATVDNAKENIVAILEDLLTRKVYVTHRLDNATEGLMVLALTSTYQKKFNELLRQGKIKKIYRVVVHGHGLLGRFEGDRWIHYMETSPRAPKKVNREKMVDGRECVLRILSSVELPMKLSEVFIELETGRTHQIRAQLSHEGFPILGDWQYGAIECERTNESIGLRSARLAFETYEFALS